MTQAGVPVLSLVNIWGYFTPGLTRLASLERPELFFLEECHPCLLFV